MIYQQEKIIADVRAALHLDPGEEFSLAEVETLTIDDAIAGVIEEAATEAVAEAPVSALGAGKMLRDAVMIEKGRGRMLLPPDFMRLIAFEMDDWKRAVTHAITAEDPQYSLQLSDVAGVRGCPERPVCALVRYAEGMMLEFFGSVSAEAQVRMARYAPKPQLRNGAIEIPEDLYAETIKKITLKTQNLV